MTIMAAGSITAMTSITTSLANFKELSPTAVRKLHCRLHKPNKLLMNLVLGEQSSNQKLVDRFIVRNPCLYLIGGRDRYFRAFRQPCAGGADGKQRDRYDQGWHADIS